MLLPTSISRRFFQSWFHALCTACLIGDSLWCWVALSRQSHAQAPPAEVKASLEAELKELQTLLSLETKRREAIALETKRAVDAQSLADAAVFAKAVEWILRHEEFYQPSYVNQTKKVLELGKERVQNLSTNEVPWQNRVGSTVLGYVSKVDGSVQPYALTLPEGVDPKSGTRWPLYVVLHGRAANMNEVNFITRHEGKPLPEDQTWIQLDVFGRTNNAYRFAGETDVFEAMADVMRRYPIDDKRITLWGFSMGGAGAWHLGMHHPSQWASVGAGAGFVDYYNYQKKKEKLPDYQDKTLKIYDAVEYAMNAANVPIITYGGELDPQLAASTTMIAAAKRDNVEIPLLMGKGMGHKFNPESQEKFMAFHAQHNKKGRPGFPGAKKIRFVTQTLKYNKCEWMTISEMNFMYQPATVEGGLTEDGILKLTSKNVAVLAILREVAEDIEIDGDRLALQSAAEGLLPDVYYEKGESGWGVMDYNESRGFMGNPGPSKRHNLQGPIDDAFMQPFVCIQGTGEPWAKEQNDWANWTLSRFGGEFDKWMRAKIPVIKDEELTEEMIAGKNLILFGDPGSNKVLAKVLAKLPVDWTQEKLTIAGKSYDPQTHGLSLIYPNPLNPQRYIVINSGHTFHEKEFKASNANLFPRLGDIAVQRFEKNAKAGYDERVEWAGLFHSGWRLPPESTE